MFERWTDRARKSLALANQEAHRLNHDRIEPAHLMLGLIKEGSGVAASVLKNLGFTLDALRLKIEQKMPSKPDQVLMEKIPHSKDMKEVLEKSVEIAREFGHNWVGTEHLLVSLARHENFGTFLSDQVDTDVSLPTAIEQEIRLLLGIGQVQLNSSVEGTWERPTWDEYFMLEATTVLSRSPDPSTKHGAVIVNNRKRPVGQGYNGFPSGGKESYPTSRPEKYPFIIHSEANAILNCTFPPEDCTLYVTGMPCNNCMKHIIQAGIKRVVYGKIGSNMVTPEEQSRTLFMAKNHDVEMEEYKGESPYIWHLRIAGYLKSKKWSE